MGNVVTLTVEQVGRRMDGAATSQAVCAVTTSLLRYKDLSLFQRSL